jgi:hypothetical protein
MGDLQEILDRTREDFGVAEESGRGRRNPLYIEMPVFLSRNRVPFDDVIMKDGHSVSNPFVLLTEGRVQEGTRHYRQSTVTPPFLAFLVGEYGLGKTEFVHQLTEALLELAGSQHPSTSRFEPLPINLARARGYLGTLADAPTASEFADFLVRPHREALGHDASYTRDILLPAIRSGRVLLLLDSLDELISTPTEHQKFFTGLGHLLAHVTEPNGVPMRYRICISVRLEYFGIYMGVDEHGGVQLLDPAIVGEKRPEIYFLRFGFFDEDRIRAYLGAQVEKGEEVFKELQQRPDLLSALGRPLLLKIFVDLAKDISHDELFALLGDRPLVVRLIELFVERASDDRQLRRAQEAIGRYVWDLDGLKRLSLDAYRQGKNQLTTSDIGSILIPIGKSPDTPPVPMDDEMIIKSVHKCPFLGRVSINRVDFAHKVFFDYFVVGGILLQEIGGSDDEGGGFNAFDKLVLSVEMRQFLKALMEERTQESWYERTRYSYGFSSPEEWDDWDPAKEKRLDRIRRELLDFMTNPDDTSPKVLSTINEFLSLDRQFSLHPRYRMYNYEAVAVWLFKNRLKPEAYELRSSFERSLRSHWVEVWNQLQSDNSQSKREALELLNERILDIARRLHMEWAGDAAYEVVRNLESRVRTEDTRLRLRAIATQVLITSP